MTVAALPYSFPCERNFDLNYKLSRSVKREILRSGASAPLVHQASDRGGRDITGY
jgi:hypothetical protein